MAAFADERRISPQDARAAYAMGRLYGRTGRAGDERRELQAAIGLDPAYVPAHLFLARNLMQAGDLAGAIERVREALEHHPRGGDLVLACYLLADLYSRTGDVARSREYAARGKQAERAASE